MNRGMLLIDALKHIQKQRVGMPNPSPRKRYHFMYLCNAERTIFPNNSIDPYEAERLILGAGASRKAGPEYTEVEVREMDQLEEAVQKEYERIRVIGRKAKRVHRALSAMNVLVQAGIRMAKLDLEEVPPIIELLIKHKVGPKKINAVVRKVGPILSYMLSASYREIEYVEPDGHYGKCVLELKD